MNDSRIIKRYNAYYRGWCLAFGEHTVDYEDDSDINWLYGEERIGLILSSAFRKKAQSELLGQRATIPEFSLSDETVRINKLIYRLQNQVERENTLRLKKFLLNSHEVHMYLTSHLFYPRTRIITFARQKPIVIMYKEMQPLKFSVE